ncbi:MAG: hypothetical protein GC159_16480 [Phycisphaera sp.]|nr:hypothetical protein [Phycisphaera sp.]
MSTQTHTTEYDTATKQDTRLRDAYVAKMKAKRAEVKATLDALKARYDGAKADARIEAARELKDAERTFSELNDWIMKVGSASGDAWHEFKDGCEESWHAFDAAVRRAAKKFHA